MEGSAEEAEEPSLSEPAAPRVPDAPMRAGPIAAAAAAAAARAAEKTAAGASVAERALPRAVEVVAVAVTSNGLDDWRRRPCSTASEQSAATKPRSLHTTTALEVTRRAPKRSHCPWAHRGARRSGPCRQEWRPRRVRAASPPLSVTHLGGDVPQARAGLPKAPPGFPAVTSAWLPCALQGPKRSSNRGTAAVRRTTLRKQVVLLWGEDRDVPPSQAEAQVVSTEAATAQNRGLSKSWVT